MALVSKGWYMTVSVMDKQGDVTTLQYELQSADATAAAADNVAVRAALNGVTSGMIIGYSLSERFYETVPAFPSVGDNSIKARVAARGSDGEVKSLDIPAPEEALFVGTSGPANNVVDTTNTALLTYLALFESGNEAFISDGENLVNGGVLDGQRVSVVKRKRRR